jgi:hypothetical protein
MKNIKGTIVIIALLLISVTYIFAIEGIQVSVQSSNAVLYWPSLTNETYIVQYRPTLTGSSWLTLTDYFAAATNANLTFFVHSNSVQYPPASGGGTNGGGSPMPPTPLVKSGGGSGVHPNDISNGTTNYAGFYRVVRDGVHLWGITNSMIVSNVLATPIEFSVGSTDQIVGVTFYDTNNNPIIGASAQPYGDGWLLVWNTTESFNGNYTIEAELDFASNNPVISQPVTVTINNIISFPNYFSQVFGDQMWIYAATIPDASYELDVYDENTNYLGSFNGNADGGGTISFLWNLVDGSGNTSASTNFVGVFTVDTSGQPNVRSMVAPEPMTNHNFLNPSPNKKTIAYKVKAKGGPVPNAGGSSASAKNFWTKEPAWTPNDNWVVAYAPLTDPASDPNTALKQSFTMIGAESDGNEGVVNTLANSTHSNLSPGNNPDSTAFELTDATSRGQLLGYLADHTYENFYYFGHGDDSHISAYNGAASAISKDQIAAALGNVPLSYQNPNSAYDNSSFPPSFSPTVAPNMQRVALHPYRFVFLDGCETARGNFSESLGIPAITVNTNFFATAGVESRAFVGYTKSISFNTSQWDWRAIMIVGFLQDWKIVGLPLQSCVNNAEAGAHSSGFQPMDSSATIYGAVDMQVNTRTRP